MIKTHISSLLIIFICALASINAQQVKNVSVIGNTEGLGSVYMPLDANDISHSKDYHYMSIRGYKELKFNDEILLNNAVGDNVYSEMDIVIVQYNNDNQYVNHVKIATRSFTHPVYGNIALHNEGLYTKDKLLYVYGSCYKTDSLLINDKFHKLVNKYEAFILVFDEAMALVDEYYFGGQADTEVTLKGLVIEGQEIKICGTFRGLGSNQEKFKLAIGGDSIAAHIGLGFGPKVEESIYYGILDKNTKKLKRGISFGGANNNKVSGLKGDNDGNVYITCKESTNFVLHGKKTKYRGYADDFFIISLDDRDSVNYVLLCEGGYNQSIYDFEVSNVSYESVLSESLWAEFYMNDDTIHQTREFENFTVKRRRDGSIEWITNLSCDNISFSRSVDGFHDRWVAIGGIMQNPGCFYNENEFEKISTINFSGQGFVSLIDQQTGNVKQIFRLIPFLDSLGTEVLDVYYKDENTLSVVAFLRGWHNTANYYGFKVVDQAITIPGRNSNIIFDLDLSTVSTENLKDIQDILVYPNPISSDELISIESGGDKIKSLKLYNNIGKYISQLSINNPVIDINILSGIYFLEIVTNHKTYIKKIFIN